MAKFDPVQIAREAIAKRYDSLTAKEVRAGKFDDKSDVKHAILGARAMQAVLTQAELDVLDERHRQVESEDWSPQHDDLHVDGELALAAATYAVVSTLPENQRKLVSGICTIDNISMLRDLWPFAGRWWKPKDRRRDLVRAGALIIAEIERIDRAAPAAEAAP